MVTTLGHRLTLRLVLLGLAAILCAAPAAAASLPATGVLSTGRPDPVLTPGAINPAVTQQTIRMTICKTGWTEAMRPSSSYSNRVEKLQLVEYGYEDRDRSHYEEDHFVALEIGGALRDPKNLWPEPQHIRIPGQPDLGALTKDRFENWLHREVCAGRLSLASAQLRTTRDWVKYWRSAGQP